MTQMDHTEAVRLQAVEKYVLGKLPKEDHAAYEEHYFDCAACAEDIKTTVAFMECVRQVAREEALQPIEARTVVPATSRNSRSTTGGWFGWLRPAVAVPVFAALLLFIGYQNGVTIPNLKSAPSSSSQAGQGISPSFQLVGSARGGSESGGATNKVRVRAGEGFTLNFDFTPTGTFSEYAWQLLDQAGRIVTSGQISGEKKYQAVSLPLSGGVQSAGKYSLVFYGADGNAPTANQPEAQRLTFTVEFLQ
jgi:Putative zinc-finger